MDKKRGEQNDHDTLFSVSHLRQPLLSANNPREAKAKMKKLKGKRAEGKVEPVNKKKRKRGTGGKPSKPVREITQAEKTLLKKKSHSNSAFKGERVKGKVKHKVVKYLAPVEPVNKKKSKRRTGGKPSKPVREITQEEKTILEKKSRSDSAFERDRALIILYSSEHRSVKEISETVSKEQRTVKRVIKQFNEIGFKVFERKKAKEAQPKFTNEEQIPEILHSQKVRLQYTSDPEFLKKRGAQNLDRRILLMMAAIVAVGAFAMPNMLATFAGSHTMEKSDPSLSGPEGPGNVDLNCQECHAYISSELGASNSSIETEKEHKQVSYLSVWTTYSTLGDPDAPSLVSFVNTTSTKYPYWSNPTTGPVDAKGRYVAFAFLGEPEYASATSSTMILGPDGQPMRDPVNGYSNVFYAVNGSAYNFNLSAGTGASAPYHGSQMSYKFFTGQTKVKWNKVYDAATGRVVYNSTNAADWNWATQIDVSGSGGALTKPTVFLGSRNVINLTDGTGTITIAQDNNAQCYVCHRAQIFNVEGSHTKVTVRGCTDAQCHGGSADKNWTGEDSLKNTDAAYRSKFGEWFQVGNCGAAGCHSGEYGYKRQPANEIGAKMSDRTDAHNRWFVGLKTQNSAYKDGNGKNISADYYSCLGCHTHTGLKLQITRPGAYDVNIFKDSATIADYNYGSLSAEINGSVPVTNVSIKEQGTVWQR